MSYRLKQLERQLSFGGLHGWGFGSGGLDGADAAGQFGGDSSRGGGSGGDTGLHGGSTGGIGFSDRSQGEAAAQALGKTAAGRASDYGGDTEARSQAMSRARDSLASQWGPGAKRGRIGALENTRNAKLTGAAMPGLLSPLAEKAYMAANQPDAEKAETVGEAAFNAGYENQLSQLDQNTAYNAIGYAPGIGNLAQAAAVQSMLDKERGIASTAPSAPSSTHSGVQDGLLANVQSPESPAPYTPNAFNLNIKWPTR